MNLALSRLAVALVVACGTAFVHADDAAKPKTMQQVLDASKATDWRRLDPQNTLYLDLDSGRVVIELAANYAPLHAENLRTLAKAHYFDGLAIVRVQDNYVTQWGDPNGEDATKAKPLGTARKTLAPEFERGIDKTLSFTALPDGDVYAPEVGFSEGFPVARDAKAGKTWLTHCYGMIGAGRGNETDSGNGSELYAVIGHAPRHLDRNIALVGRVVQGMEHLTALPRGHAVMGFYDKDKGERGPLIRSLRLAAELAETERLPLEVLRTDTPTFAAMVESRRNRRDDWYKVPAGRIEVCNVPLPVRSVHAEKPAAPKH